jgi:hypothetical protein
MEQISLLEYIQIILALVKGGLSLNPDAFKLVYAYSGENTGIMLWIIFIAGVSFLLGQSVTLFANRVSTGRFWFSIFLGALKFFIDALIIVLAVWAIANLVGQKSWSLLGISRAVALTYAPYWLSFLFFIPYLGVILPRVIKVYVFLALVVALQAVFMLNFPGALLGAFAVTALSLLISTGLGRLFNPIAQRISNRFFGDDQIKNSREILDMYVQRNHVLGK